MNNQQHQTVHNTATEAIKYLASTDEECARAKSLAEGLSHKIKRVKAIKFLSAKGTVAEREATAYSSVEYEAIIEEHQNAVADYEILRNKRNTANAQFEWARSMNANRRMAGGNL